MSNETIDVQATAVPAQPAQSQAVAIRQSMAVGQAMGVQEILAQVKLIQEVMRSVMTEGEHYGTIPGCGDKKTLLQPGAQKLTMTFRLAPEYQIQETDLERGHKEYRVVCTLKSITTGAFVGQGVGCCSSMESKYRYRGGARRCPECGKEAIVKGKKEYGGGWLCFAKKGGCGAKWPDGAQEIESQSIDRVENEDPADTFNTVLKIAKKRAFVDATITATAASDIFTQDIGDEEGEEPEKPLNASQAKKGVSTQAPARPNASQTPPAKPAPAKKEPLPFADEQTRARMIRKLGSCLDLATEYFRKLDHPAALLDTETLQDLPLQFVPITVRQFEALQDAITAFGNGEEARHAFPPNPRPETPLAKTVAKVMETVKPVEVSRDKSDEAWRQFPMPWGKQAGTPLEKLEKNYLFGLWANYQIETEFRGKPKRPDTIAKDEMFRAMLDLAGKHYEFRKSDDEAEGYDESNEETQADPEDDIPM